jgi:hypothetical protein
LLIEGFQNVVNQLIENRLEQIITSEEYNIYSDLLHKELDEKLSAIEKLENEDKKQELIDEIRNNIFDQVHLQSKLAYRTAFSDAWILAINTLIIPRKI